MINYNEIKDKYPKAFELLIEWGYNLDIEGVFIDEEFGIIRFRSDEHIFNSRYLYDFFDEQGIKIIHIPSYNNGHEWCSAMILINGLDANSGDLNEYSTRTDAETNAFTKAFELLERKLLDK